MLLGRIVDEELQRIELDGPRVGVALLLRPGERQARAEHAIEEDGEESTATPSSDDFLEEESEDDSDWVEVENTGVQIRLRSRSRSRPDFR